jgi:hypothetical protein
MVRGDASAFARATDGGRVAVIRVSFPCESPEETVRYAGDVPAIVRYITSFHALCEELVSVSRFRLFPHDSDREKQFVVQVEYNVPSISAFFAGGDRRHFMKRLAIHEVANVFAEALQFSSPTIGNQLRAKYPDPRRYLDALFRKRTGVGDLARVYQRPRKAPLRNRTYFDR